MYFPNGLWSPGPRVSIDESVVSFGNVECGKSSTGVMHIKNESDVATVFQVRADTFLSHGCLLPASITIKLDQCSHTVVKCTGTRYIKESYKLYYFSNPSLSPSLCPFPFPTRLFWKMWLCWTSSRTVSATRRTTLTATLSMRSS